MNEQPEFIKELKELTARMDALITTNYLSLKWETRYDMRWGLDTIRTALNDQEGGES